MSYQVEHLSFSYGPERQVLRDISFSVAPGQLLALLGPNGVGKSTLFRCMLGLSRDYQGQCLLDGVEVRQFSPRDLARQVAYIPQSHYPTFNFTVFDMVLMGTTAKMGRFTSPGEEQRQDAAAALERMELSHLAGRGFGQISGGERQLALVARALAQKSRVLVMDEPTANLDYGNRLRVLGRVRDLTRDGYTIIQSTHAPEDAFRYSDTVLALHQGRVAACGPPCEVITPQLVRRLYGVEVDIYAPPNGAPVCIPAE